MRFKFSSSDFTEFVAMWRLLRDVCERHGFPDDMLEVEAGMVFTGIGGEKLEALLAECEGIDLLPQVSQDFRVS